MENLKINNNAKSGKRILGFCFDIFFTNFLRGLLLQIFVLNRKTVSNFDKFIDDFTGLFGKFQFHNIKDYHIRYFVDSQIFDYFARALLIICFTGVVYNFICYLLFKATIGQKIMSLRVTNMKNDENPNVLKLFWRSLLVPFPFVSIFVMAVLQFFYLVNFHLYAPIKEKTMSYLVVKITYISNPYTIIIFGVFFILFWYNIYYITDRLILPDIASGTRVVNSKLLQNKKDEKDFVYFGDRIINNLERFNKYLEEKLFKYLKFIKDKFSRKKKESDNEK